MGAVASKRKKNRKRNKEPDDLETSPLQDLERLRSLSKTRLNRLSADIDRMSVPVGQMFASDSLLPPGPERTTMSLNRNLNGRMVYHFKEPLVSGTLNLDDHPVLTKLQNEQNARLEHMEQRITKIRTNAMQAAERRKYAQMFRAKSEDSRTAQLLKEASEALEALKRERKAKIAASEEDNDKGEIIPVRILGEDEKSVRNHESKPLMKNQTPTAAMWPVPLQSMKFSEPSTWLLLPFLLPLLFVLYLIRSVANQGSDRQKKRQ